MITILEAYVWQFLLPNLSYQENNLQAPLKAKKKKKKNMILRGKASVRTRHDSDFEIVRFNINFWNQIRI